MEIIIEQNGDKASETAARLVIRQVRDKPNSVLGLATGRTPLPLYRLLVKAHRADGLDFSKVTTFNLDEYAGLAPDHPASYHHFMRENLFAHLNMVPTRCHIPDGLSQDIPAHCQAYEEAIRAAGGIDLQVLGLGSDGHLGFNEPGSSLASRTRIKTLTEQTRQNNREFFSGADEIPHHVITMGLGTIMDSRVCLLLAFGPGKAEAVQRTVEGPVTASVPGSVLQFHPCAKVFLDEEAATRLERAEYYRWAYQNKPAWQIDR